MQLILAETSCRRTIACFFEVVIESIYDFIYFLTQLNPWFLALLVCGLIVVVFVLVILVFVAFSDRSDRKEQNTGEMLTGLAFKGASSYWKHRKNKAKKQDKIVSEKSENKEQSNQKIFTDLAVKGAAKNRQENKEDTPEENKSEQDNKVSARRKILGKTAKFITNKYIK